MRSVIIDAVDRMTDAITRVEAAQASPYTRGQVVAVRFTSQTKAGERVTWRTAMLIRSSWTGRTWLYHVRVFEPYGRGTYHTVGRSSIRKI